MAKPILTAARARALVHYDSETGEFTRLITTAHNAKAGDRCTAMLHGYAMLSLDGTRYRAHRVAWLYMTGSWPNGIIDHINGDPADNRFVNLRDTTHSVNRQNQTRVRSDNLSSGITGVSWCGYHRKWKAHIRVDGVLKHLKYCDSMEDASAVYARAKREFHPAVAVSA